MTTTIMNEPRTEYLISFVPKPVKTDAICSTTLLIGSCKHMITRLFLPIHCNTPCSYDEITPLNLTVKKINDKALDKTATTVKKQASHINMRMKIEQSSHDNQNRKNNSAPKGVGLDYGITFVTYPNERQCH